MLKKLLKLLIPQDDTESDSSGNISQRPSQEQALEEKLGNGQNLSIAGEDNIIDVQANLLNAIAGYFKPYYGKQEFKETIVIWVANEQQLLQAEVREKEFEEALRREFQNRQLEALVDAAILFETQTPPQNGAWTEVTKGVFIEIRPLEVRTIQTATKAQISLVGGTGSLFKETVLLDSTEQRIYNIGRCEIVRDNGIHINHIAIRDNDNEQASNNNCVSRKHARIVFKEGAGFCLQALTGGCRPLGGGSTKVFRNEIEVSELRDISMLFPMRDGDLIELGKAVLLKFETKEENHEK
ncbi:MAG: hypothetical protein H6Q14_1088 [Bacteroidetes bacterium]|nr:hypothetical protein [Bacteroidota bacterium]